MCGAGTSGQGRPRPVEHPAPTITGHNTAAWLTSYDQWQGSPFMKAGRKSERGRGEQVSVTDAGILQGFRSDYPWQGNQTSQHTQLGDAIPPALAAAVLEPLLALTGFIATEEPTAEAA